MKSKITLKLMKLKQNCCAFSFIYTMYELTTFKPFKKYQGVIKAKKNKQTEKNQMLNQGIGTALSYIM